MEVKTENLSNLLQAVGFEMVCRFPFTISENSEEEKERAYFNQTHGTLIYISCQGKIVTGAKLIIDVVMPKHCNMKYLSWEKERLAQIHFDFLPALKTGSKSKCIETYKEFRESVCNIGLCILPRSKDLE